MSDGQRTTEQEHDGYAGRVGVFGRSMRVGAHVNVYKVYILCSICTHAACETHAKRRCVCRRVSAQYAQSEMVCL